MHSPTLPFLWDSNTIKVVKKPPKQNRRNSLILCNIFMYHDILSTLVGFVYFNRKHKTASRTPEDIFIPLSFVTILAAKLVLWLFKQWNHLWGWCHIKGSLLQHLFNVQLNKIVCYYLSKRLFTGSKEREFNTEIVPEIINFMFVSVLQVRKGVRLFYKS